MLDQKEKYLKKQVHRSTTIRGLSKVAYRSETLCSGRVFLSTDARVVVDRFTHFCLGSVDTRSKQVDTSPRFQKTQLPDWDSRFQKGRSTLAQGRSTLDPVSSRLVCRNGTAGRH
ncbi:hypothetical protein Taro_013322 [Colocasia esculenta]|uniref:Uncharacterized protein n=1 Tax=Colocasia esculenta TaxID=4460 RepID=A0A843UFM6_COLES|nr:hypothetical protein [Colocasia esculenta]